MLGKCQQKAIAEEALTSAFEKKPSRSAIACPEAFYLGINLVATGILVIDSDNAISQTKILTHFLGTVAKTKSQLVVQCKC